jgi:serine protease Do
MFDPLISKTRILLFSASSFVVGVGAAAVFGWTSLTATPTIVEAPQVTLDEVRPAVELSDAFVNISRAVTPAVIRIEAEMPVGQVPGGGQGGPQGLPQGWEDLFPNFPGFPEMGPENMEMAPQTATGSGFIVSPDGYILTNNHVVSGATRITVYLADRRQYTAQLIGRDPTTDVAVIKINGNDLPVLSLGSSADVKVGEWVLAVGNPGFGGGSSSLDYTVTAGIVSAIGRPLQLISSDLRMREGRQAAGFAIEDFIQTDAVINPGNSGGPLVNMMGQVVGINSAIASQTGYYQGYGFAIPMDLAKRIMEDLVEFGEIRRPYLGIMMESVTEEDAELYGLPRITGVFVQDAPAGGPAAAAGIQQEDVIVSIDGVPVERTSQLQLLIAQRRPGDEVTVGLYRDRRLRELAAQFLQINARVPKRL